MRAVGVALGLFVTGQTIIERPAYLHGHRKERKIVEGTMTGVGDEFEKERMFK